MKFNCIKDCDICEMDCDLFGILESIIDALSSVSDKSFIEICFRKQRNISEVVCRLRPYADDVPEFIGIGKTYKIAMINLIESLQKFAIIMSIPPPPLDEDEDNTEHE